MRRARVLVGCSMTLLVGCRSSSSTQAVPAGGSAATPPKELAKEVQAAVGSAQPGEEREVEPGAFMTMYRTQATAPLRDGWQLATSTKGRFSVEMPLPFNDFRMRSQADDHVEIKSDTVGAKSPGQLAWSATCIERADGKLGPPSGPPPKDGTSSMGTPVRAWQRMIVLDHRVCVVIVEAQGTDPLPGDAEVQRFLTSFKET